jgi:hypothetical protein
LAAQSRVRLLALAEQAGLRGRHRLSKAELIRALSAHAASPNVPPPTAAMDPPVIAPVVRHAEPAANGLPWRYDVTELVAMLVDPVMVYLYWELTPTAIAEARRALGPAWDGAAQVLRAYDVAWIEFDGTNAHRQFDTGVYGDVGAWYLHLWSPEQTLIFELGWRSRDGRFVAAARSNPVQTPRDAPCEGGEERWMTVRGKRVVPADARDVPTGSAAPSAGSRDGAPWSGSSPQASLASRRFRR